MFFKSMEEGHDEGSLGPAGPLGPGPVPVGYATSAASLLSGYAPADFEHMDDYSPASTASMFDIIGNGNPTPYTTSVDAMIRKHTEAIRAKGTMQLGLRTAWRKKFRDFISEQNTRLLEFLDLPSTSYATLSKGDSMLRRFGLSHHSVDNRSVRDIVMDISGVPEPDVLADMAAAFEATRGEGGLKDYATQTQLLFEEYRTAGEEALMAEKRLAAKLKRLDQIQSRVTGLLDIETNDVYGPLLEASEAYIKKVYEENQIAEDYKALVAAFRKFALLREIVVLRRMTASQEAEPLCTLCLDKTIAFVLAPCGHTLCAGCCRRQGQTCFMCRSVIRDRIRMYFG